MSKQGVQTKATGNTCIFVSVWEKKFNSKFYWRLLEVDYWTQVEERNNLKKMVVRIEIPWVSGLKVKRFLTLYCSRFFSLFISVSSRSLWIAAICLFLSLMAWSRDFSSFLIHLSLSSLEVNWLPRPCLAYRSVLSWVAWASLERSTFASGWLTILNWNVNSPFILMT